MGGAVKSKSRGKVSLIWFKDDEPAWRMRVHPAWLRALTYLGLVVLLVAAGGMLVGYEFWRKTQEVTQEKREVEKRLSESMIKLERLQNIEKLLQNSDPSELKDLLSGIGVEMPGNKQASPGAKGQAQTPAQAKPAQASDKPSLDLTDIMGRVDIGQVGVENFRVKLEAKTVQVSFDLNNLMPQSSLAGSGQLLAVARDGTLTPLEVAKEELAFQIQRFKQFNAQALMPATLDRKDLFGLRLVIANSTGKTIYSETYPLAQAQ
jgi:hypothetical protein